MLPVMWDDGFISTKPVKQNITTQFQLNAAFEPLVYDKGAALIRMLEAVVGENELRTGLIVSSK
jgi:aminopeptidase N